MGNMCYTVECNVQILISLLKAHGVRKIIASPGTTNIAFVGSVQNDSFFEVYSSVDERSAAYMACGLAAECGEPVVITCTGATASRNYMPGLTEAYYRKLPVIAITGSHGEEKIGHLHSQVIDRSVAPNDVIKCSVCVTPIHSTVDEWSNSVKINQVLLEMKRFGGGPVHINLVSSPGAAFTESKLPNVIPIQRCNLVSNAPQIPRGKVAVFVGSHRCFQKSLVLAINHFCEVNDAVVFCDKTSGYSGKYAVNFALVGAQYGYDSPCMNVDLLIHIGEVSGDTYTTQNLKPREVWRVCEDGELRDHFKRLTWIFETTEESFFEYYAKGPALRDSYLKFCKEEYQKFANLLPEFEFGNVWIAKRICNKIPENSVIHLAIYNSLRSWNFFHLPETVQSSCNVGGFGIDGPISTLLGASLANKEKLYFLVTGDLAFFYDMNALGNHHLGNNIRILLVNNGKGVEFRKKDHPGSRFGDDADRFIAAGGHFGNKSRSLVKHFSEDLGFEYLSASDKLEFERAEELFLDARKREKPILLEVFPDYSAEIHAVESIRSIAKEHKNAVEKMAGFAKRFFRG